MRRTSYVLSIALLALSTASFAADAPKKGPTAHEKAEMEAMMKAGTPGEAHQKLAPMIGTFDVKVTMWNTPTAPPMESTGKSVNTWVLGNRWVAENFEGNFMGMPFVGIGYTGYDNVTKQYQGTWMDSMSTGVMTSTGKAEGDNAYSFDSTMPDPASGKNVPMKSKGTIVNKNKHVMEMWAPAPDGKMFKMMEITYTRKKS